MKLSRYCLHRFSAKLVICWLLASSGNLWADDGAGTPANLRFAIVYVEEPPFIYIENTDKYKGIVPYLVQALSRELDLELEYIPTSRKGLEATIISGQADVTWLSPEWVNDKEKLIFSNPVFDHKEFLYSLNPLENNDNPVDWVRGKTICVRQDYQYPSLYAFLMKTLLKLSECQAKCL